jgi:hypothetical protein
VVSVSPATDRGPASTASGADGGDSGADGEGDDGEDELAGREIDRRPTPLSAVLALAAASVVAIAASVGSTAGGALAGLGVVALAPAVVAGYPRLVDGGALALLGGVALGGSGNAPELWLLVATVAAVVAWDAGQTAISLGGQLGRDASTARAEVAHSAATVAIGTTTAGVAYVVYLFAGGSRPLSGVVVLLVAVAILLGALR